MPSPRMLAQLDTWRRDLVNLNRTNRLLYYRPSKTSTLSLSGRTPDELLAGLQSPARAGWGFQLAGDGPIASGHVSTDKDELRLQEATLRALERKAAQEFLDKGLSVLYVALGMLAWQEPGDDRAALSPLVLVPVTLTRSSPREPYRVRRVEEDRVVNPALEIKLQSEYGVELPDLDAAEDGTIEAYFQAVEAATSTMGGRLERTAVLAPFSFHKEVMFRDLMDNAERIADHPVVTALGDPTSGTGDSLAFDRVPDDRLDAEAPPEDMASVLPADSSQRRCVLAARQGQSFVMDGPPGTGKSQTITNMIAELLKDGRTVLFVSEKAAALEVVRSRLGKAGLGAFVLELHSHKATRKEVAQELGRALSQRIVVDGPDLPAQDRRAALRHREQLTEYAQAMNELRAETGNSLHATLGRLAQLESAPAVSRPHAFARTLTTDTLAEVVDAGGSLSRAWGPVVRGEDFLWRGALGSRPRPTLLPDLRTSVGRLGELAALVTEQTRLPRAHTVSTLRDQLPLLELLADPAPVPEAWLTAEGLDEVVSACDRLRSAQQEQRRLVELLAEDVGPRYRQLEGVRREPCTAVLADLTVSGLSGAAALDPDSAAAMGQFLTGSATTLADLHERGLRVAATLGLPDVTLTLRRAQQLAEVGELSGAAHRPEARWLDPLQQGALTTAASVLEALVADYRTRQSALSELFTDEVLTLDLTGLARRFSDVYRWYSRLGKAYRTDKKQVVAVLREGTRFRDARRRLEEAADWKSLSDRLDAAEKTHSAAIGTAYYQHTTTDFGAVVAAVEVAKKVVDLMGREATGAGVAAQIGRDGHPDSFLARESGSLLAELGVWLESATRHLGQLPLEMTLPDLSAWCLRLAALLAELGTHLGSVAGVSGRPVRAREVVILLAQREALDAVETAHPPHDAARTQLLGPRYDGLATDQPQLEADLAWTQRVRTLLGEPAPQRTARQLLAGRPDAEALSASLDRWHKLRDDLLALFDVARHPDLRTELDGGYDDVEDLLAALSDTAGDIDEWRTHSALLDRLRRLGLSESVQDVVEQRVAADLVAAALERAVLEAYVDRLLDTDGRLAVHRSTDRDALVSEFQALDRRLLETASHAVVAAVTNRRPRGTAGVAGTIVREAAKKTKHMPVRRLLSETAAVTQKLKPCFMMSPLTVSQFLTSDMAFDVVIFDEASQVLPADAINCIYRANQVIVAGDQKQLPPTSFFMGTTAEDGDDYDEEQLDEFESLLDLCKGSGGFTSLPLLWHYRSQHESLITFSNYSFYEGQLVTFPGAADAGPDVGVELRHVPDGVYRRGGPRDNPREAAVVVDLVLEHARQRPSLSCGVVALSEAQAAAIEIELDRRRRDLPELDDYFSPGRLDGFFVKNLESVQGDERDIIVFSVGYGRDENGKVTNNFGPVNKSGGWRRLNVAATRSRRRVDVVSSITTGDVTGSTNESVLHLKRYLDYAERGMPALAVNLEESHGGADSPFEEEVTAVLRGWGYDVVPQVGSAGYRIDMGVRHPARPGSFAIGIECDGAMYHSSKVARDRDRLREEVLRGLGWQLHRIWGTGWYRDRPREEERLHEAVRAAIAGNPQRPPRPPSRVNVSVEEVDLAEAPAWTSSYVVSRPRRAYGEITDPTSQSELLRVVRQVATDEGPVHLERLLRRVRDVFGATRSSPRIRTAVEHAILRCRRDGTLEVSEPFVRVPGGTVHAVRVPDPDDEETRRKVDEVPGQELRLAIRLYVGDAHSIGREGLIVALSRLFGWGRVGPDIRARLDDAVDDAVNRGDVVERVGQLQLPQGP